MAPRRAQEPFEPMQGELDLRDTETERSWLADLLEGSRLYRTSKDYLALLDFVSRLRNFAPFNAMLLQIQKPGLTYAASAWDWKTRFNRTIKEGARPLVILWPFAPVAFVFDVLDTAGDKLPADIAQTFHATGPVTEETLQRHYKLLDSRGIHVARIPEGDGNAGRIMAVRPSKKDKEKPDYQVRINQTHDLNVQFVTLAHELGHLFLGHLGPDQYLKVAKRPRPDHAQRELEAESLAYLVCNRRGVTSKSQSYLANYVAANTTVGTLDLDTLFKAAGQVEAVLGIAAETLFPPRPVAKPRTVSKPKPRPKRPSRPAAIEMPDLFASGAPETAPPGASRLLPTTGTTPRPG